MERPSTETRKMLREARVGDRTRPRVLLRVLLKMTDWCLLVWLLGSLLSAGFLVVRQGEVLVPQPATERASPP